MSKYKETSGLLFVLNIFSDAEIRYSGNSTKRQSWSKDEIEVVEKHARAFIENCEMPTLEMCAAMRNETLKRRSAESIKSFIANQIKNRKVALLHPGKKSCRRGKNVNCISKPACCF